jgi:DNA-binding Lrp family transcriptional regulator
LGKPTNKSLTPISDYSVSFFDLQILQQEKLMSTIFHQGRKLLRLSLNGNHNLAEIADLLHFRISGSSYKDKNGQFFLLPNIEHLSENTGFGKTTCVNAIKELVNNGFIKKIKTRCYDNAVRTKIYLTKKFKCIMNEIANLKNAVVVETKKEPIKNYVEATTTCSISGTSTNNVDATNVTPDLDSPKYGESDSPKFDESIIKEQTKKNNIVENVVSQIVELEKIEEPKLEKSLAIIDSSNIPEFTQDKVILDMPTVDQIDTIETITQNYEVDGSQLFETVLELSNTKADYFEDFNQILAVAINQQLEPLVQAKEFEIERAKCKYEIDFRATEFANDERKAELDDSQNYAVYHNLKYLQKKVGKRFDFDELKGWVTHSLKYGYKGLGFQKTIRCIVKAIKEDKYTRPYSLKAHYLEAKA